jgi:hypothetical protein
MKKGASTTLNLEAGVLVEGEVPSAAERID